jgi:hypothetical protein
MLERATGIEPAWPAWKTDGLAVAAPAHTRFTQLNRPAPPSVRCPWVPGEFTASGTRMARDRDIPKPPSVRALAEDDPEANQHRGSRFRR